MRNIDACGCGQDFALGVLYSTQKEEIPIESKILKALEISELLSSGVCRPFNLI